MSGQKTEVIEETTYYVHTISTEDGSVISKQHFADVTLEELKDILAKRKQSDEIRREIIFKTTYRKIQTTTLWGVVST